MLLEGDAICTDRHRKTWYTCSLLFAFPNLTNDECFVHRPKPRKTNIPRAVCSTRTISQSGLGFSLRPRFYTYIYIDGWIDWYLCHYLFIFKRTLSQSTMPGWLPHSSGCDFKSAPFSSNLIYLFYFLAAKIAFTNKSVNGCVAWTACVVFVLLRPTWLMWWNMFLINKQ